MASSRGWFPLLACLAVAGLPSSANFREASPWGWRCVNETCIREEDTGQRSLAGLSSCKLTCNRDSVLWPRPTGLLRVGQQTVHFLAEALTLRGVAGPTDEVKQLVTKAFDIFKENVNNNIPETGGKPMVLGPFSRQVTSHRVDVDVTVSRGSTKLLLDTSEAYTLGLTTRGTVTNATILATTFFGARHALETLSQLIEFDDLAGVLEIVSTAAITDVPFFKYRGILLDTARNYFSVKSLERTLDAMAANKLNTFHWHITDSQSFPLYLENLPKMAFFGAYSPRQIYRPADVRHLVEYGRVRGVRVLPEFSAPGHVGNGWQWTEKQGLGKIAVCVNQEPWRSYCSEPPCGQLDVLNNNTFTVLSHIYKEMVNLFSPLDLFHFGGSEVNLNCWNTTDAIVAHLEEAGLGRSAESFYKLWADFQKSAYHLLSEANLGKQIPGILLNSRLTEMDSAESHLDPQHYIIQLWTTEGNQTIKNLLQKGFRVIFSNYDAWHLGCGLVNPVSTGENLCSTYMGWQTVYDNSPINIVRNLTGSSHRDLILGGEAALYTHQVDEGTLDSKLWPRGSALAERLWTNPDSTWLAAETRLIHHRQRLVKRGVMAERIQPQWCHQNEGLCYL
ncbi:chitooligosaccharidolytic beta-N-acetylglucosaminidase [Procambarus clarkii]|uniref:chitooligosaccharidolytic beta-N-acetylglucosaminidase n=1 Tax=Procambarus clarkii TaxID=6728 RepID=UPI0037447730